MKNKHDQGFSLIEILVAIVILTAIVVPTCSALVMTNEMNNRSDELMKAQLAVSSAVETLMAQGIKADADNKVIGLKPAWDSMDYVDQQIIMDTEPEYVVLQGQYSDLRLSNSNDQFSVEVFWIVRAENSYSYKVTAISKDGLVEVTTSVRKVS